MTKRSAIAAGANIVALVLLWPPGAAARPSGKFVWLSDVHFDPTANPKLVDLLAEKSVAEWPKVLASDSRNLPGYGEDANWALFSSTLNAVRGTSPDPDFIVVTGDILVHHFRERFQQAATNHGDGDFPRFAMKTMEFVAQQLKTIAPGKPVLFTIGNNDTERGDYASEPGGAFLKGESAAISQLLGPLADETSARDWTALGSYSVPHPALKHVRVIAVNSIPFSPKYRSAGAATGGDPAMEEMHWLAEKLAEAEAHKDKVWLIFHIPPGVDGFATARLKAGGPQKTVFMWKPACTEAFGQLLERYHNTVTVNLAGHEHADTFRLIGHSVVLMTPAVSPLFTQNPAFRVVSFAANGRLTDATTYYLSNLSETSNGAAPAWKLEYSFAKSWRLSQFGFKSFSKLYDGVETRPEARDRWATFYSASHPQGQTISRQTFPYLFCAAGNVTEASFSACLARMEEDPQK